MRICAQCKNEMIEGFDIKVQGGVSGIKITKDGSLFAKRFGKPKVAICPKCGEISLYIENLNNLV